MSMVATSSPPLLTRPEELFSTNKPRAPTWRAVFVYPAHSTKAMTWGAITRSTITKG